MSVNTFSDLAYHEGHELECVVYGDPTDGLANAAVECLTCGTVLIDFDNEEAEPCHD